MIFKSKRIHDKDNATKKEFWLFLWYTKQDDKDNPKYVLDTIAANIMTYHIENTASGL